MQTRWIQGVQRWPIRSLQTKATLLVIAIVAGVLALSTFLISGYRNAPWSGTSGIMPSLWHSSLRPVLARGRS
jgi:hypothetical protein